jgi:hypothetical protein
MILSTNSSNAVSIKINSVNIENIKSLDELYNNTYFDIVDRTTNTKPSENHNYLGSEMKAQSFLKRTSSPIGDKELTSVEWNITKKLRREEQNENEGKGDEN